MRGVPAYGSPGRCLSRRGLGDSEAPLASRKSSASCRAGDEEEDSALKRKPRAPAVVRGAGARAMAWGSAVLLSFLILLASQATWRRPGAAMAFSSGASESGPAKARLRDLAGRSTQAKDHPIGGLRDRISQGDRSRSKDPEADDSLPTVVFEPMPSEGEDSKLAEELLAAQMKAEKGLLFQTKQMSQPQLDAAMAVMAQHQQRHMTSSSSRGKKTSSRTTSDSPKVRGGDVSPVPSGPSTCLGNAAPVKPPGSLLITNTGGKLSHWVKKLGGPNDPRYVHMAMVERLANGSLVAMWQQAMLPVEGSEAQEIRYKVSVTAAGDEWFPERLLRVRHSGALWSPVMHYQDGTLYVLYSESRDCIRPATANNPPRWFPGGDIKLTSSSDNDLLRWEKPRIVLSQDSENGVPKVLANKLIVRSNGEWVLPFWREIPRGGKSLTKGKCITSSMRASAGVLISKDKGGTWRAHGEVTHSLTWLIENTVVEIKEDRSLLMLFRSWAGRIFQSRSTDGGLSWSNPSPTILPNPDAKIHAIALAGSNDILLAYNDHQKYADDGFTAFRTGLRLAISHDRGDTWARIAEIDEVDEPGWQFHYPTVMQHGCNITVAYTRAYVESPEDDIEEPETPPDAMRPGIRIMTFDLSLLASSTSTANT